MDVRTGQGFKRFASGRGGATAIEYGLIAGIISLVIVAGTVMIGDTLVAFFGQVVTGFGG